MLSMHSIVEIPRSKTRFNDVYFDVMIAGLRRGLVELQPIEDRPAYYLMWLGAQLRECIKSDVQKIVPQTVFQLSSNFYRSAGFFIETLAFDDRDSHDKACIYTLLPGTRDGAERTIHHHLSSVGPDLTPDYDYAMTAFFRQPVSEGMFRDDAQIAGCRIRYVGDFIVGEGSEPNHRLYFAAWNVIVPSLGLRPCW